MIEVFQNIYFVLWTMILCPVLWFTNNYINKQKTQEWCFGKRNKNTFAFSGPKNKNKITIVFCQGGYSVFIKDMQNNIIQHKILKTDSTLPVLYFEEMSDILYNIEFMSIDKEINYDTIFIQIEHTPIKFLPFITMVRKFDLK